jgi:hypothetical protein
MSEQNENQDPKVSEDRRDSPRVPMQLQVQRVGEEGFLDRAGDLSLGGVGWVGEGYVPGQAVVVRFTLADPGEVEVKGEVLPPKLGFEGPVVRVRFQDLTDDVERAIARYLDKRRRDDAV